MPRDTSAATAGKIKATTTNLRRKVDKRDELLKRYRADLRTFIDSGKVDDNKEALRSLNKDIKKLETEIQSNIRKNYAKRPQEYDDMFTEMGGRPKAFLKGTTFQFAKNETDLAKLSVTSDFVYPTTENLQDGSATLPEVADAKGGFGRKGGKVEAMQETSASMRGASNAPPKAESKTQEATVTSSGEAIVDSSAFTDLNRAREMPEREVTRMKQIVSYLKQFKPDMHEQLVLKTSNAVTENPLYSQENYAEERDILSLYYARRAFDEFPIQQRNNIIDEVEAASNIVEQVKASRGEGSSSSDPPPAPPAETRKNPLLRGGDGTSPPEAEQRRRGPTDDAPARDDDLKIKSGDNKGKANAEPGEATTAAEKNAPPAEGEPFTEQPTTVSTPGGTVEPTDPDSGTKFEGAEGELEIPFGGAGAAARAGVGGGAGAFKNDILSQLEPQSELASKLAEDKKRRRKDVDRLIKEIECYHLVYDEYIPLFRSKDHMKAKEAAIASKDRDKLVKHHAMMANAIRQYYKTADLRVGVIMSAESMFGQSVSNLITGHMQSGGAALPNAIGVNKFLPGTTGGARFIPKGSDPVRGAIAGNVNIRRGGRNTKRPTRFVPKAGVSPEATDIPEVVPVVDAPRPYVAQTGLRSRRQFRDPQLKLKVSKK